MRTWWIRFGCFLTGYNYDIMKNSSEASAKSVKKYTSAILIVSIIWGFIGYSFANRYLHLDTKGSIVGAIIMIFIVIQIEKQIILNVGKNKVAQYFRVAIALVMAVLGSIIVDQMIFKDDIELQKEASIIERVDKSLPIKVTEINNEILRLDSLYNQKSTERTTLIDEVTRKPTIVMPGTVVTRKPTKTDRVIKDKNGNISTIKVDTIITERSFSSESIVNPKAELIPKLDEQIKELSSRRDSYNLMKIGIREKLELEFKSKVGFLDELEMMTNILFNSYVALFVWILWFSFLVFIELFVVSSKWGNDTQTDYDITIIHQRDVRINAINQLSNKQNHNKVN